MVPCPKCKMENAMREVDDSVLKDIQEEIQIPTVYRNIRFNGNELFNDNQISVETKNTDDFKRYVKVLQEVYEKILTGVKISRSIFISAEQGFGKKSFVYSCINAALRNGKSVAPYLDTGEIHKLIKTEGHSYNIDIGNNKDGETLSSLTNADICFIKMRVGVNSVADTQAIKVLVDRRAKRDLPTILVSRVSESYLYSQAEYDQYL